MRKQPLRLSYVRSSNLHGFWKRLKSHGFKPGKEWSVLYKREGSPYTYIRTFWTFTRKTARTSERWLFALSVHGYRMKVTRGKSVTLDVKTMCWSHLERPFLKYLCDKRPLEIRRLGKQTKAVSIWLQARELKEQKRISEERRKAREKKRTEA